jgi:hypothetical protein
MAKMPKPSVITTEKDWKSIIVLEVRLHLGYNIITISLHLSKVCVLYTTKHVFG